MLAKITIALLSSLTLTTAITASSVSAQTPTPCPTTGSNAPAALHSQWIMQGWEHHAGDPTFSFRDKLGRFYDWSARDGLFFDDFDPQRRAVRSAAAYGAIWEPIFRRNRSVRHVVSDAPTIATGSGDLAASSLEFTARIDPLAGKPVGIRTRSDLVWRCDGATWKIVREHNSSKIIPVAQADRALARKAG